MSMKTVWNQDGEERAVTAPLSLIVSGFAPVLDVRRTRWRRSTNRWGIMPRIWMIRGRCRPSLP
jgi:phosphoribosylformylglycinamidine (FGAM) synthase-like enzyme